MKQADSDIVTLLGQIKDVAGGGGAPTGAAGGDLAGTYPNPTIKSSVTLTTPNIGAATGSSLNSPGSTTGLDFGSSGTYYPVQVGQYDTTALSNIQEFHSSPAVAGGLATPTDFLVTPKLFSTNGWAGITVLGSTNKAWPYIEFLGGRGTLATPTVVTTNDLIGEVAGIAVDSAGHYRVSSLIDMRVIGTVSGGSVVPGQIEFSITDATGTFDQTSPNFKFNAQGAIFKSAYLSVGTTSAPQGSGSAGYFNGNLLVGDTNTLDALSKGLQVSYANSNAGVYVKRGTAANYSYSGYTPEVTLSASHPHWGAGLYGGTYDYTIWQYTGSANVKSLTAFANGGLYLGPSPTDPGAGAFTASGAMTSGGDVTSAQGSSGSVGFVATNSNAAGAAALTINNTGSSGHSFTFGSAGSTSGLTAARSKFFVYDNTASAVCVIMDSTGATFNGDIYTTNAGFVIRTKATLTGGGTGNVPTLTSGPVNGNPTKWLPIDDNGVTRYVPSW